MRPQKIQEQGVGLIDLMVSCVIVGILAAFTIPNAATGIANMRLRGTVSDFSGLVQRARLAAVQNNATYTVRIGLPSGNGAYVDLNGNGSFDAGEPMIQFGGTVNQVSAPGGGSGKPTNLDASGGGPLGWTATAGNISFNARGLPCDSTATPCGTNVNYVYYFSDTRAAGSGWAAVSVTAAGHPRQWTWNGSAWAN
jgi:Tfp pilus assembly protein FimT